MFVFVNGFVYSRKYTRADVFRILGWSENPVAQNVGGYLKSSDGSCCPIFVTYEKGDDGSLTTQYEDRFLDPGRMEWYSKSRRNLQSPDVQYFKNAGLNQRLLLFVKKNDDEGVSFYFVGDVCPTPDSFEQREMPSDNGKSVSVVRMVLELKRPMDEGLFQYFASAQDYQ
jgi:hypothetical protein